MKNSPEQRGAILEKWLPDYKGRAEEVARAVSALLSQAFYAEDSLSESQEMTESSLAIVREGRSNLPPLILYIYSARFDKEKFSETVADGLPENELPGWETRLREKAARAEEVMTEFACAADLLVHHYTASLMAPDEDKRLPLVWEVPALHEEIDDLHPDAAWWMSFMLLCELSVAICAYGGCSRCFLDEITHIEGRPELARKLFWLEANMNVIFPSDPDHSISIRELPKIMERIAASAG